jgi:DNA invertase Pin-like site-specific DNA recombinase
MKPQLRAAIYARISTLDQEPKNQLRELRRYVEARGWVGTEFVDRGVSGAKDSRPALVRDARRRKFDVVVTWSLDRLGRSLKHLITLLDDLRALDVGFISVKEGLDWTTPTGRLQAQLLAMIAEFERARTVERVRAGMARAKAQGHRVGRPPRKADFMSVVHLSVREAATRLGVSRSVVHRWRLSQKGSGNEASTAPTIQ